MTKYGREMMASTRRPPAGAAWAVTIASALVAIALAVTASMNMSASVSNWLWFGALAAGTVAIAAWYALAIHWARRRKRLWG